MGYPDDCPRPAPYPNLDLARPDQVYFNARPQRDADEICGFEWSRSLGYAVLVLE